MPQCLLLSLVFSFLFFSGTSIRCMLKSSHLSPSSLNCFFVCFIPSALGAVMVVRTPSITEWSSERGPRKVVLRKWSLSCHLKGAKISFRNREKWGGVSASGRRSRVYKGPKMRRFMKCKEELEIRSHQKPLRQDLIHWQILLAAL